MSTEVKSMSDVTARSFDVVRNALADFAHVASTEAFVGIGASAQPLLTIGIPTFRRSDLLIEAVRSAISQDFDQPFEVVVLDNDPQSRGWEALLEALPELARANFRYIVNAENIGLFGNWNRCIEVARGEWFTMLHDDDLLDASFARRMFELIETGDRIDGLVCIKVSLDVRETPLLESESRTRAKRTIDWLRYRHGSTRRIGPRQLFWGNILGSNVGFLCRKRDIEAIGGFYPEEDPSGDYFFYARFARRFRLFQTREGLATFRMAQNNSAVIETQIKALCRGYELQQSYAGRDLPGWWRRMSPWLLARHVTATTTTWRTTLDKDELERRLGVKLPRDRPVAVYLLRALLGGY